jgi:methanol metabolism-related c-type cytochrome
VASRVKAVILFGLMLSAAIALDLRGQHAIAEPPGDPKATGSEDGKFVDKDGNPTYSINGKKVDYYTYAGYVRYAANCLQCHGPDGLGSSYAPSLVNSLQHLNYGEFVSIVAGGKKDVSAAQQLVMPALGENKNVMCYIDAIYVYLRARSTGALDRQRPEDHEPKPAAYGKAEDQCMG